MDESELERKAVEELLKETSRAKVRAETMGATGWMKCPLGSTNKRFLLNTLRSSALTRQPANQRASERERDEHKYKRACEKHRNTDCEKCNHKKDYTHRRYHSDSHSHTSKHRSTSHSHSSSRCHSPHLSRKSKRTRSRSPVRDSSPDVKKYTDRGGK
ncbi:Protein POLR1D, isoform 2 [Labeo rohita]|uniref:Protein POLR1D, isoform 2 n=1 Tax=Labeo rohita TaxID=84645 RepID=A0ABQ8LF91_LABRO|nr:protein POLR1D-like [Labeo rohita]KAI2648989.1 Protein POLR1D, isoform 2 [Labeo rohita]